MAAPIRHIKLLASLTDEELLSEFKKNFNQQMLAQLYLRYTDLVYSVCMKYFKNAEVAKDAAMNIYQELLTKLQTMKCKILKAGYMWL